MPNITDMKYRSLYHRITLAGETIGHHEWGDSPRFRKKQILCVQSKIACK
jgi:hypothetical protein